jgi:tetratricopeptide (TPR) repeat protein
VRPEELATGRLVAGRYEILRFLGQGGMGEVYAARRMTLGDVVAIKRLLPDQDTEANRRRFATEARAAAHIRHPNVVQVFDFGDDDDLGSFLVMEHLDGPTLAMELGAGPLSADRTLWIFSQVCAAVEAGHRRGIVHRDLKPSNVIIAASDDGSAIVKVLDFGLALDQRHERHITTPGALIGTVAYMAPEQAEGLPATPASDIFALGVLLYEMATGQLPFPGDTPIASLLATTAGHYRPADEVSPGLPRPLVAAIDAALTRAAERRPASAELLARMAAGAEVPVEPPRRRRASSTESTGEHTPVRRAATARTTADTTEGAPLFGRFVGRGAELGRLRDEYDAALAGRGRVSLIVGEAGVGKSRLAEHFALWARERGALTLSGRFFDYAGSRPPPLETFLSMLAAAGPRAAAAAEVAAEALAGEATSPGDRWRGFAAIADALVGQAAGRPLVLILDDLQWAGRLDLDLVDHLHRTLGPRGTQIVATARAGGNDLDPWRASRAAALAEIALPPFDEAEVRAWLDAVFRGARVGALDVRRLAHTTGGNPYALAEIVRHLVGRAVIRRDDAGWRVTPLDSVELPDSVTTVVRARLAELTPVQLQLLELAAVIGDQFRVDTLAAASGLGEDALDGVLDGLFARLITDRGVGAGADFRFVTPLVRQVLYDDMPARHRRRAHKAVVGALRENHGDGDERWAHVFAYHCHAIGEWAEAVGFGVRAAHEALVRHDFDAARASLARAEDAARRAVHDRVLIAATDRARLDLAAGVVAIAEGKYEDAEQRLAAAAGAASALGLAQVRLDALRQRAQATLGRGNHRAASALARQASAEAERAGDRGRALAAIAIAINADQRAGGGDLAEIDELIADLRGDDPPALHARLLRERALIRRKRGDWALAADDAAAAHGLARAAGDLDVEQMAVALLGTIRSEAGDAAGALETERQALVLAERLGDRRREAIARANVGETIYHIALAGKTGQGAMTDAAEEAVELLRGALASFVDIGDRACEGDCRVNVGRALLVLGRTGEARQMLERGVELCAATSRAEYEGIGHLSLGRAHLEAGATAAARDELARAIACFASISYHQTWQAELAAARAALADGDPGAARQHAEAARARLAAQRAQIAAGHDPATLDRGKGEIESLLSQLSASV